MKLSIAGVLSAIAFFAASSCAIARADETQRPTVVTISLSNVRPGGRAPGVSAVMAVRGGVQVCEVDTRGNLTCGASRPLAMRAGK